MGTTFAVFVKNDAKAIKRAGELTEWLKAQGVAVVRVDNSVKEGRPGSSEALCAPADIKCMFVLGGDGTFLSAVRWVGDQTIPILGVKFGDVGFLAETAENDLIAAAKSILHGEYDTISRMRLHAQVLRPGSDAFSETVLNDVVINKGALARLANIQVSINDHYLTTFRADGLIIATPTGSTAYSLAAGGPIIHPSVPGILITPICPFTLTNRPLIVPDSVSIEIKLEKKSADIMLTFDGQVGRQICEQDTIVVRKSLHPVTMITIPGQHYFDVLKNKLSWSGGRG